MYNLSLPNLMCYSTSCLRPCNCSAVCPANARHTVLYGSFWDRSYICILLPPANEVWVKVMFFTPVCQSFCSYAAGVKGVVCGERGVRWGGGGTRASRPRVIHPCPVQTATEAGSTHRTGMHSCCTYIHIHTQYRCTHRHLLLIKVNINESNSRSYW